LKRSTKKPLPGYLWRKGHSARGVGDGEGGGSGDEKERKIIEGGYFYEVYIINCFVGWSGFVDSFFLC
jgi:hypothetical protein